LQVVVCEGDGPLLGCAILASVGIGVHASVEDAVANMVRVKKVVDPSADNHEKYKKVFERYKLVQPTIKPLLDLRGGGSSSLPHISPSLLGADPTDLKTAIASCETNECVKSYHLDCFDGVAIRSPKALTSFGPIMLKAIRELTEKELNVHLIVEDPIRYVDELEKIGIDTVIVHNGLVDDLPAFVARVAEGRMNCGLSLDPEFVMNREVEELLESGMISLVIVMTVPIGFGGASFDASGLVKIDDIRRRWPDVNIHVDGGVTDEIAKNIVRTKVVDALVAGTFVFGGSSIEERLNRLAICITKK